MPNFEDYIRHTHRITAGGPPFIDTVLEIKGLRIERTEGRAFLEMVRIEVITDEDGVPEIKKRTISLLKTALQEIESATSARSSPPPR